MMQPAKYVKRSGKGCTTPTLESLEGRLLLSSAPYIYHDPDGDVAKITLSGAGTMDAPTLGANGISSIYLENTSSASSVLTITLTSRTRTSDGLIKIGFIDALTDGAGMKSINAPKVDLTGQGISMTGWLGSVTVHDLLGATTQIGAWTVDGTGHLIAWPHATKVVVHNVGDGAAIVMSSYITSLTANRFGVGSKLHATVLQNVKVNGSPDTGLSAARMPAGSPMSAGSGGVGHPRYCCWSAAYCPPAGSPLVPMAPASRMGPSKIATILGAPGRASVRSVMGRPISTRSPSSHSRVSDT